MRMKKKDEIVFNEKFVRAIEEYSDKVNNYIKPNTKKIIEKYDLSKNGKLITYKAFSKLLKIRKVLSYNDALKVRFKIIAELRNEGMSWEEIGVKLNVTPEYARQSYNKNNPKSGGKIEKEEMMDLVLKMYKEGGTLNDIAEKINMSSDQVRRTLRFLGVKIRENCEIAYIHKNLDNNYFSIIDSKVKAWILGFIWADGSIGSTELSISQDKEHDYILKKIAEVIGHNGSLTSAKKSRTNKMQSVLSICRKMIVRDLQELGLTSDKENDLSFPFHKFSEELELSFTAGFFSGDGSIIMYPGAENSMSPVSCKTPVFQITSTNQMNLDIRSVLLKRIPDLKLEIRKEERRNAFYLNSHRLECTIKICELLSQEGFGIYHTKKFLRISRTFEIYRFRLSMQFLRRNPSHEANKLKKEIQGWLTRNNTSINEAESKVPYKGLGSILRGQSFCSRPALDKILKFISASYKDAIDFDLLENRGIIPPNKFRRVDVNENTMLEWEFNKSKLSNVYFT